MLLSVACVAMVAAAAAGSARATGMNWLVIGDWGGQGHKPFTNAAQLATARGMAKIGTQLNTTVVLAIGDNFYSDGVDNVHDSRFKDTFEDVYTDKVFQDASWYVVAGNHDHHKNVSGEIAYSAVSKRWNFPDFYYRQAFSFEAVGSSKSVSVDMFMIDTVLLAGTWDHMEKQPVAASVRKSVADAQIAWLKKSLEESTADWKLVVGHYPVYSIAEHGPTQVLIDEVEPLLRKYHVPMYTCGHDHNLQLLEYLNITYVLSGAAHGIDSSLAHKDAVPKGSSKFHWGPKSVLPEDTTWEQEGETLVPLNHANGGFATFEFKNATALNLKYYDQDGSVLYAKTVYNTNPRYLL